MLLFDRIFSNKGAYAFGKGYGTELSDYLADELVFQLRDLEKRWAELEPERWKKMLPSSQEMTYLLTMYGLEFRLGEILRFLKSTAGPKIIQFVCSEIYDLVEEHILLHAIMGEKEFNQATLIITVMNSYFQPELFELHLNTGEQIASKLKEAAMPLVKRSF